MKYYINPPTVNNPDLTPLLNVEGPIEVYDVWEVFREDIIKFLEDLPNEVTYHTADGNLKNDKLKIVYDPYSFLTEISFTSLISCSVVFSVLFTKFIFLVNLS